MYLALSPEDKIKEQIKFNTEILKLLGLGILTTSGGSITLYIQRGNDIFTIMGTIIVVLMGILGFALFLHTRELLK